MLWITNKEGTLRNPEQTVALKHCFPASVLELKCLKFRGFYLAYILEEFTLIKAHELSNSFISKLEI